MAGAFSGHLINQYNPNSPFNSSIVSHGAMSFNPNMHGMPQGQPERSFSFFGNDPSFANDSISEESARKLASLQVKLNQKLGPEYISQRPGPGGGPKLTYVEGWKIINLANEVFGFNGWSSTIVSMTVDFADYNEESRRFNVGVTAVMRVTLRDGVFHEDVGYGMLENSKSKGQALDKCKKEAVTDGLKRALRSFGNVMGNCLYDKSYASEIVKVKFEPKKFNKDELHRRPEFEDVKPNISSSSMNTSTSSASMGSAAPPRAGPSNYNTSTSTRLPVQQNQVKPITSLPPHMRSEVQASGSAQRPPSNPNTTGSNANARAPAQRPTVQPPQLPPAPAKALAPPPVPATVEVDDDDDSFGYNSDDDALIAMADLGPAIDPDIGRPIDHDEGLLQPPPDEDEPAPPARAREPSAGMTRHELIAAALAGDAPTGLPYADFKLAVPIVPRPSGGTSATASAMLGMRPPPPPQPRATTSLVQQNHQRYMSARPQDQNRAPAPQAGERVPSPSAIGGFNFPGGVNPVQSGVGGMSLSGVGMKRPADAMSSSTSSGSSFRGGRPGMGLPQTSSGPGPTANKRNILGALDITDGGNVKRPRL